MSGREVDVGKSVTPVPALGETRIKMSELHLGPVKSEMKQRRLSKKPRKRPSDLLPYYIRERDNPDFWVREEDPFSILNRYFMPPRPSTDIGGAVADDVAEDTDDVADDTKDVDVCNPRR